MAAGACAACSEGGSRDGPDRRLSPGSVYPTPAQLDDGWTTGAPVELGLSPLPMLRMSEAIRRGDYPNVHGLLIAKDGRLAFEEYFHGQDRRYGQEEYRNTVTITFDRDSLHDVRSIAKSVTSALVGLAVYDGAIPSLDTPLADYFPERAAAATAPMRRVTLRHALTMSAGLDWNEQDVPLDDPTNDDERLEASADPVGMVFGRGLVGEPGSSFYYNGGLPLLLGVAVSRTTGLPFGSYARERLFGPLGFGALEWAGPSAWVDVPELVWDGVEPWSETANPAGELWILPRDLLKFGSLYLNDGQWNGRAVLPDEWVDESLRPHVWLMDASREHGDGISSRGGYGYLWWYDEYALPYGEVTIHYAGGNGGQRVWVVPSLDLVAVHLAGNYNLFWAAYHAERLLLEHIVPWALGIEPTYRHEVGRPARPVEPEEVSVVPLTPSQRARYVGVYEEPGARLEVRDDDGVLRLVLPGAGTVDLIPQGDHVFAMGRLGQDGVPYKLFWPDERAVFVLDEVGDAVRYEYRDVDDGRVWGEGLRLR